MPLSRQRQNLRRAFFQPPYEAGRSLHGTSLALRSNLYSPYLQCGTEQLSDILSFVTLPLRYERYIAGGAGDTNNITTVGDSKSRFFFVFQQVELKQKHPLTK